MVTVTHGAQERQHVAIVWRLQEAQREDCSGQVSDSDGLRANISWKKNILATSDLIRPYNQIPIQKMCQKQSLQ